MIPLQYVCQYVTLGVWLGACSACLNLSGSCLFPLTLSAHDDRLRGAGPRPWFHLGRRPQADPDLNGASSAARSQAPRLPGPATPLAQIAHQLRQPDLDWICWPLFWSIAVFCCDIYTLLSVFCFRFGRFGEKGLRGGEVPLHDVEMPEMWKTSLLC